MQLERLEAMLSTWHHKNVFVRVPLVGTVSLIFFGELICQEDTDNDAQFLIYRDGAPALVFYIKDVSGVYPAGGCPTIFLNKIVDQTQVVE